MPKYNFFLPLGTNEDTLKEIILSVDELEAVRLTDLEGMYHEHASKKMNISRQTFGRIIESARKKIAEALINGLTIKIQGGNYKFPSMIGKRCAECDYINHVKGSNSNQCPKCGKLLNVL